MMRVGTYTSGHDTMQMIISEQSTGIYLNVFFPISCLHFIVFFQEHFEFYRWVRNSAK